jgi:hypothetical protein
MMHRAATSQREAALLLWSCVALFAARVIGQLETMLIAPQWLPDMDAWFSGLLPYPLLLPAQIAILMVMAVVAWNGRIRSGAFAAAHPRIAAGLRRFAYGYFVVMAVRLAVNVAANGADFWRAGAIPVAFHWVLALFLLVVGRARIPAQHRHEHDEPDDVPHGDVPALAQPLADGFRPGK